MRKLQMLVLCYYFPPIAEPRAIQVARLLRRLPATVTMICGAEKPSSSPFACDKTVAPGIDEHLERVFREPFHRPRLFRYLDAIGDRCLVRWSRLPDIQRGWVARAGKRFLGWQRQSGYRPDVLVTFGQPMSDHLFGLKYKALTGTPWIAHFSDPWADDVFGTSNRIMTWLLGRMERQVIEKADAVLYTSPETIDLVWRKYPVSWRKRASYLPHCYDTTEYDRSLIPAKSPYVLRFIGTLWAPRSPKPLYEAIERIGRETPSLLNDVSFEFIGTSEFIQLADEYPVARRKMHFRGVVPHAESLRLMQTAHCLLVIDAPADLSVFFPSKLVEYIGAQRFILAITPPGASARIVKEVGGWVADPSDGVAVTAALRRVLEQRPKGLPFPATPYEREVVSQEFLRIVETAVSGSPKPCSLRRVDA